MPSRIATTVHTSHTHTCAHATAGREEAEERFGEGQNASRAAQLGALSPPGVRGLSARELLLVLALLIAMHA